MNTAGGVFASPTPAMVPGLGQGISAIASWIRLRAPRIGQYGVLGWKRARSARLGLHHAGRDHHAAASLRTRVQSDRAAHARWNSDVRAASGGAVQCWGNTRTVSWG